MTQSQLRTFKNQASLNLCLADDIATSLVNSVRHHGHASLVVSGGRTPGPLFDLLSSQEISWDKVSITLADERWVDPESAQSNEHLVRSRLLKRHAAMAQFISLKDKAATPHEAEPEVSKRLSAIPKPFTVVLLGMGDDGHTASFFPGSTELIEALDAETTKLCCGVTPRNAPHQRMTLTLPMLLCAEKIILHITGDRKLEVYNKALKDNDFASLPVRAILNQRRTPVIAYWAP